MSQKTKFKELNLSNAFLFAAALEDSALCGKYESYLRGEVKRYANICSS